MRRRGLPPGHAAMRTLALAPAAVLFAILVAHSLLETARDALFLARLGPHSLALAYLAIAACAIAAIAIARRWLRVRDPRRALVAFLVFATIGTAVLAASIAYSRAFVFALYVWTGFVATLVVPSFWAAIDRTLEISEAKRVFGAIGAGGVLGAMTGSAIAAALGRVLPASALVTAGALAFALATSAAIALVPRRLAPEPPARRTRAELRSRDASRYMRLLVAVTIVATVALTLGDLTFKTVMSERVAASELAVAFGAIYTVLNAIGLAIQVAVTPRLLARWGVGATLAILPVIVLASALGFALTGTLIAVIALKLGDGGLRHSLHRVGSEILYLPVPSAVRDGGKLVADALGQRGGQAVAAVIAGVATAVGGSVRAGAALTAVAAAAWLAATVIVRRAYVRQLRESLRAGEIQRDVAVPQLDAGSAELLVQSIASSEEIEALAALDLLARRAHVPASALRDGRPTVVRHALSLLGGELSPEIAAVLAELHDHADVHVRAAALAAAAGTETGRVRLVAALDDESPHARAVALVHLAGDVGHGDAAAEGIAALSAGTGAERIALAEAIAFAPGERFRGVLHDLLGSSDANVGHTVLRVLARSPELADLGKLLRLLPDVELREDTRRVFYAAGERSLDVLTQALDDPATPIAVRRHLPRTIMRIRTARAATALATRLPHEADDRTERKLLRALGRMRRDDPTIAIDAIAVHEYATRTVQSAARYAMLADELELASMPASPTTALIRDLLADKQRTMLERGFRAFEILEPNAGWRSAYDAIESADRGRIAPARELVDAIAPLEMRTILRAMVDRLARGLRVVDAAHARDHAAVVAALLADPSESLRCAVARHVVEHRLIGLRDELSRLRPFDGPPLVLRAFDEALAGLHA